MNPSKLAAVTLMIYGVIDVNIEWEIKEQCPIILVNVFKRVLRTKTESS